MNKDLVMDTVEELRGTTDYVLKALEQAYMSADHQQFSEHAISLYDWLVFTLRPSLYAAIQPRDAE